MSQAPTPDPPDSAMVGYYARRVMQGNRQAKSGGQRAPKGLDSFKADIRFPLAALPGSRGLNE